MVSARFEDLKGFPARCKNWSALAVADRKPRFRLGSLFDVRFSGLPDVQQVVLSKL